MLLFCNQHDSVVFILHYSFVPITRDALLWSGDGPRYPRETNTSCNLVAANKRIARKTIDQCLMINGDSALVSAKALHSVYRMHLVQRYQQMEILLFTSLSKIAKKNIEMKWYDVIRY